MIPALGIDSGRITGDPEVTLQSALYAIPVAILSDTLDQVAKSLDTMTSKIKSTSNKERNEDFGTKQMHLIQELCKIFVLFFP